MAYRPKNNGENTDLLARIASLLFHLTPARKTWRAKLKLKIISYINFALGVTKLSRKPSTIGSWWLASDLCTYGTNISADMAYRKK